MRQDLENSPTDYESGRDFYLTKTKKGEYANYASSSWSMKERPLSVDELEAIDKFGLQNLSQFLPKKPDDAHLKAIMEMFQASVEEEMYDPERWGQFYRPSGMRFDTDTESTDASVNTSVPAPAKPNLTAASIMSKVAKAPAPAAKVVEEDAAPWAEDSAPTADAPKKAQTPEDILAAIRRRQQGK